MGMDISAAVAHLACQDEKLAKVINHIGELKINEYNSGDDSFVFLVREIIGQMISAKVKQVIYQRFIDLCDNEITPEKVSSLTVEQLRGIGLSNSKSNFIISLANSVLRKEIVFEELESLADEEVAKRLMKLKGIGKWTSKMYLIFFLRREDVLPYDDVAFQQAYKWLYSTDDIKQTSIEKRCKAWKPYTSIGARYLYRALDTGLVNLSIDDFLNN